MSLLNHFVAWNSAYGAYAIATLFVFAPGSAKSTPVVWAGNGNSYEVVLSGAIDWDAARSAAIEAGGHLATIASAAENDFVFSLANDTNYWYQQFPPQMSGPWLGGFRASADNLDWHWVTGESFAYSNWETNQPDNGSPGINGEDALHFFAYGISIESTWNDAPHEATVNVAYVVEWEALPEPASATLFALAILGFTVMRLR